MWQKIAFNDYAAVNKYAKMSEIPAKSCRMAPLCHFTHSAAKVYRINTGAHSLGPAGIFMPPICLF
ncbi:hypothetical protein [Niabella beijingensis]|uniref:hypothetical protein n=1 Tax=Niabella beijingensis TaxID=2872700 RepID=UPI001CBED918|nr:hypothetical protein [Niabella beijingensis]MBZ4191283.1 hypothetical protein [Niabella beijingensis]